MTGSTAGSRSGSSGPEDSAVSFAARRRLGRLLKELRENKGITVEQAYRHIDRSRPWFWRLEEGLAGISIKPNVDVGLLCDLYGVDDPEHRSGLMSLAADTRVKGWFQPYRTLLPPQFDIYLGLESVAAEFLWYEAELVPGLLQTAEYAEEVMREEGGHDEPAIAKLVALRLRRQEILTRRRPAPPLVNVVLNEAVVRRPVGGPTTMTGQLRHLTELGELPNVSLRIVPFTAGLHRGVVAGPFVVMQFSDKDDPPMVYVDGFTGVLLFKEAREISKFEGAFDEIRKCSLDDESSRELINKVIEEQQNV